MAEVQHVDEHRPSRGTALARRVFAVAGWYGIIALAPQYFMEGKLGRDFPPPITHPEQFYGFLGVALAWQILFLLIARDPVRYRPAMIPAMLEKLAFGGACVVLYFQGRLHPAILGAGVVDIVLLVFFVISYLITGSGVEKSGPGVLRSI